MAPRTWKWLSGSHLGLCHEKWASTCLHTGMSTFIKRIVVLSFVTTFLAIVGAGCNTAHGFGKDVKNAGQGIEDGTK